MRNGGLANRVRRYLQNNKWYILVSEAKWNFFSTLTNLDAKVHDRVVVSLKPQKPSRGDVLLSYIIDAFLLEPDQPFPNQHTNCWASWQMAKTFLDLGFCVDVISNYNQSFTPEKDYSVVIDARGNLERL